MNDTADSEPTLVEILLSGSKVHKALRRLSPKEFVELCVKVLEADEFLDVTNTDGRGDGGLDGTAVTSEGRKLAFQCKRRGTGRAVGVGEVRDFESAVRAYGADIGLIITNSSFTSGAESLGRELGIELMNGGVLSHKMVERKIFVQPDAKRPLNPEFDYAAFGKNVHHTVNGVA